VSDEELVVPVLEASEEDPSRDDASWGGGPSGGGPPGGGPLAIACSSPLASSDAESSPSPFVSRLENAALSALVDEESLVEAALVLELLESPRAVSISDRLRDPFVPNWLIRSFARVVAASSKPEVEAELDDVEPSVPELS